MDSPAGMQIVSARIDPARERQTLMDAGAGAYAAFEGWIRNSNEGQAVLRLEYEAYAPLAVTEGARVIREACAQYPVLHARCVHRVGLLEIGECAVWVGVSSAHRDAAFLAARYIIDEVKVRLPIWKKEHYVDGHSGWVNCERCAAHAHQHRDSAARK
ncbi:MAG TPA: molybdenum cofactor biosynthesis protein MoaE [Woeseiaceae bacterium]|nr:molybdenum cofactor biosynthesis protein MoaE [Woeseiaceae bacterium]